ncbi:MAG: putative selenate reductase subunit YgfK, partial [Clostridia bacterium]|nr:putative selenate reductase subunit YgfK [Clostridia bacterium]
MSERMNPIPFEKLLDRVLTEYAREGTVFGVHAKYEAERPGLPLFGGRIETPFGPAAGPNTQLSENIVAGYFTGARFFELKTVQKMDGEDLARCINRPCIKADDEGYNCEWSTELTVPQAFTEYVNAYVVIKIISKLWHLGDPNGFMFNMSVGYDLAGIKTEKIDTFIEGMKDASGTAAFKNAVKEAKKQLPELSDYIDNIDPHICTSVTISTLHGCPPEEIESIASYLITEKKLHTLVKCNPTILGYDFARKRLDEAGFDYVSFDDHHFREDLQYKDAVPMFHRLLKLAADNGVTFGLKLSNTCPVDVKAGELPSEEMYMSGKSLYLLTIEMAARMAEEFDGKLRLSFSGGADAFNLKALFRAGIWPITVATTILKPGGYDRFHELADEIARCAYKPFTTVNPAAVRALSDK